LKRIAVVHNIDFEDVAVPRGRQSPRTFEANSEIQETARSVAAILNRSGCRATVVPVNDTLDGLASRLRGEGTEAVFNLVESLGNDASREPELPALLETLGIPYTGNSETVLKRAHQKDTAREILAGNGIPVPGGFVVQGEAPISRVRDQGLRYPVFVKPARADASIGIDARSIVHDRKALVRRVDWLRKHLPGPVLVEEFLPGREFNVALFPDPFSGTAVATEIDFSGQPEELPRIVTYNCKWIPDAPEAAAVSRPCAGMAGGLVPELIGTARKAFRTLGGTSYGRVDLRLDTGGRPRVIDVNPNPGLDPESGFVVAARSVHLDYRAFILLLAQGASLKESHALPAHPAPGPLAPG
jgi:D-alanine-D-alanine ligase